MQPLLAIRLNFAATRVYRKYVNLKANYGDMKLYPVVG